MSYPSTIRGAVFITTSGDTAISASPLHHYQQQQLIEHESRLFIGPEMRVAFWVVHRVVCLFLLGQRVYKLYYSKVKDKRREKRMHIHTHMRANNGLQPKRNCFSTSSLSISKSVLRASPVSLLSVIVLRKICLKTPHCTEWPLSRRCGNGQMCRTFQGLIKLTAFGLLLILLFPALYLHRQRWALVVNSITDVD